MPHDPEDLFWTHFELLRKCRMVAIRGQPSDDEEMDEYTQALSKKTPRTIVTKQVKQVKPISKFFFFQFNFTVQVQFFMKFIYSKYFIIGWWFCCRNIYTNFSKSKW